jgi:hypothetical protein
MRPQSSGIVGLIREGSHRGRTRGLALDPYTVKQLGAAFGAKALADLSLRSDSLPVCRPSACNWSR